MIQTDYMTFFKGLKPPTRLCISTINNDSPTHETTERYRTGCPILLDSVQSNSINFSRIFVQS